MSLVLYTSLAVCAVALWWIVRTLILPPPPAGLEHIPRIPPITIYYNLFSGRAGIDTQMTVKETFGKSYAIQGFVPGKWMVWFTRPAALRSILKDTKTFPKLDDPTLRTRHVENFFGSNIVTANGADWSSIHSVMAPSFHWEMLEGFMSRFVESSNKALRWVHKFEKQQVDRNSNMALALKREGMSIENHGKGVLVDVVPLMQRLTMDVLGQSIFSFDFNTLPQDGVDTDLTSLYNNVIAGMFSPVSLLLPFTNEPWFPGNKRVENNIERFSELLVNVLQQRRAELNKEGRVANKRDLLDTMAESDLTLEQVRHNLNVLFLAGHDTTSTTLSVVLNFLALYPEHQDRVRAEIQSLVPDPQNITYKQQKSLTFTTQVIKESLRMFPPVGNIPPRETTRDVEVDGVFIPQGTLVSGGIYQVHHDPELWENADVFDPDRWGSGKKQPANAWLPFGGGERICLGMNFSLQEQRTFLSVLLSQYRVEPGVTTNSKQQQESGRAFDLGPLLFLQPKNLFLRFVPLSS